MRYSEQLGVGAALLKLKLLRRRLPLYVQFVVTNSCNQRCSYCNIPNLGGKDLSLEEITGLIGQLRRLGTRRVVLLGGEPLVRPDIGEIIRLMKRQGMFVGMVTNGWFVPSRIDEIRQLDTIAVSLDGAEPENDAVRGEGSFKKAVEALEAISAAGMARFLSSTIVRSNLASLDTILELADRFRCKAIINLAYHSNLISCQAAPLLAPDEAGRRILEQILLRKRKRAPILLSEGTYRYLLNWPDLSEDRICDPARPLPPRSPECQAGKYFCYIDAGGDMSPCALWAGDFKALNVVRDGARAAWENCRGHGCRACSVACFVDYNSIFSLDSRALLNSVRFYKSERP